MYHLNLSHLISVMGGIPGSVPWRKPVITIIRANYFPSNHIDLELVN